MTMTHFDAGTAKLIGETIRNERLRLGITKAEAARRAILSRRTWHEIEEGTRSTSTAETLTQIDRVIGFREGTLFGMTARSADARIELLREEAIALMRGWSEDQLETFVATEGAMSLRQVLASLDARLAKLQQGEPDGDAAALRRSVS